MSYSDATIRLLNAEGIYIRTANDAIRFNYGLMKGLQKLASKPEALSESEQKLIEDAKKKSKANLSKVLDKAKADMDKYVMKTLRKHSVAYGFLIAIQGPIHKGNVFFKFTHNFFNRRGDVVELKEFRKLASEASKEGKDYAPHMLKALEEIDRLSNLSSIVYEGKGEVPKEVNPKTKMLINLVGFLLDTGVMAIQVMMVSALVAGHSAVLMLISIILGGALFRWLLGSVRVHGFKGTIDRIKLNTKRFSRTAHAKPSLRKQAYLLSEFDQLFELP